MTAGKVTLRTTDRRRSLTAWLGPNEPSISGGTGGWSEVQRPRKPAAVEWNGAGALTATIELMLEVDYRKRSSANPLISAARALVPLRPTAEPPVFTVAGHPSVPSTVPFTGQGLTFSGWEIRSDGTPIRVLAAFDLIEYRAADVVTRSSPAKRSSGRNGSGSKGKPRTYIVKRGDTLGAIAARLLGSASKASSIASLNKIRDYNKLVAGQKLKIPSG